jgi:hypothetical protein
VSHLDARAWEIREIRERVMNHMEARKNLLRAAPGRRLGQESSRRSERVVSHMEAWKNLLRAAPRRRLGQEVSRKRVTRVFWGLAAKLEALI